MEKRISKLKRELARKKISSILISSPANIFYLTGFSNFSIEEREGFFLVSKYGDYFITDKRYEEEIATSTYFPTLSISKSRDTSYLLKKVLKTKTLHIEEGDLRVSEYKKLSRTFTLRQSGNILGDLRTVKDLSEIASIKKACELSDKTFSFIVKKVKKGVTEQELACHIEIFLKTEGGEASFSPIVAFGENSSMPHHKSSGRKLGEGEVVLLDFGASVDGYCSDMTRTLHFGPAKKEFKEMYSVVLNAQKEAINYIQKAKSPGCKSADKDARNYIKEKGYPEIPHSLGHGIGIEVHEHPHLSPRSKEKIGRGMVFSIEPGIYIPGKFGIRIEDLFNYNNGNLEILTHSSHDLIEL